MPTRHGPAIALTIGLCLASPPPLRALAPGGVDEVKNQFGFCRLQLRNLTAAVRARLDDVEEAWAKGSEVRRRRSDQMMVVMKAQGAYGDARLKVEVAEIELMEYEEGTAKQTLETIEGDLAMAKADLKRAEDRFGDAKVHVEETKTLIERIAQLPQAGIYDLMSEYYAGQNRRTADGQLESARFSVDKARFTLEQAIVSKDVFLKYTKEKTIKERRAAIARARADMLMKQAELELAKHIEARLERDASHVDDRALTRAESAAMAKFAALEKPWKAILARRGEIEKPDPAKRDELKKILDDFARSLDEADRAWSAAREARLDDRDAETMRRSR